MKFKNEKQKEFVIALTIKILKVTIALLAGAGVHDVVSQL